MHNNNNNNNNNHHHHNNNANNNSNTGAKGVGGHSTNSCTNIGINGSGNYGIGMDNRWDICMQALICHINGINHVSKIAELLHADMHLLKELLKQLIYYKIIVLIDSFQFSNRYMCTQQTCKILHDKHIQKSLLSFVWIKNHPRKTPSHNHSGNTNESDNEKEEEEEEEDYEMMDLDSIISSIYLLYCCFNKDKTCKDIILYLQNEKEDRYQSSSIVQDVQNFRDGQNSKSQHQMLRSLLQRVDFRKLVIFGMVNHLLRRVYGFPILASSTSLNSGDVANKNDDQFLFCDESLPIPQWKYHKQEKSLHDSHSNLKKLHKESESKNASGELFYPTTDMILTQSTQIPLKSPFKKKWAQISSLDLKKKMKIDNLIDDDNNNDQEVAKIDEILKLCNGAHCFDEICCRFRMSLQELMNILQYRNVVVLYQ
ncbi:hypothetical protein RFI_26132 [Reticulomyxa filosa]|uniref:Uncharacterized protein n=1 Tax=Reticulomyxa filosa TaxID=46433 RepID=X6MBI9_RETFI|nr:hypothetical protein RFI_26132 [Reticulomyxa filosa]|eukprot:ETO11244.1 hypothetical protein RFI_26132 [Reticulomyxa filosa]